MAQVRKPSPQAPAPAASKPDPGKADDTASSSSWRSWLVGWVLVPGVVIAAIVGAGVYVGANLPEFWFTRFVAWVMQLFAP